MAVPKNMPAKVKEITTQKGSTQQPEKLATVRIGKGYLRKAKAAAAANGITLQKYIERLIEGDN